MYSATFSPGVAANGSVAFQGDIIAAGRKIRLITVTWEVTLFNSTTNVMLQREQNTTQQMSMVIDGNVSGLVGNLEASPFLNPLPVPGLNGGQIYLTRPEQKYFEAAIFNGGIHFGLSHHNWDGVNNYTAGHAIMFEVEILDN